MTWNTAPDDPGLQHDEVHIWRTRVDEMSAHLPRLCETLEREEINRADRFHFRQDRQRFIVARSVLRIILSRYLKTDPRRLRFVNNDYGKPALASEDATGGLSFNLSHSHEMVLYAFGRRRRLGVDVERLRHDIEIEQIAARFFSAPEVEALRRQPPDSRAEAFFSCWTRKEAYIKARGEGLSHPLDRFAVSIEPHEIEVSLEIFNQPQERRRWFLRSLAPGPGYAAAVAIEGRARLTQTWHTAF